MASCIFYLGHVCQECMLRRVLVEFTYQVMEFVAFVIVTCKVPPIEEEPSYDSSYHGYKENGHNYCCYWKSWPQGSYEKVIM